MTSRARKLLPWGIGLALTVAACVVSALTPSEQSTLRAIVSSGDRGEVVHSRELSVELQDATFADQLVVDDRRIDGNWLIVTAAASTPTSEVDASIRLASVTVDGRIFLSSDQAEYTLLDEELRIGVRTVGMIAFELPPDVTGGTAALRLTTESWTPELDALIEVSFDLGSLARDSRFEIIPPAWEGAS